MDEELKEFSTLKLPVVKPKLSTTGSVAVITKMDVPSFISSDRIFPFLFEITP